MLVFDPDGATLSLSADGVPIGHDHLTFMARGYIAQAKIGKMGACHLFRHYATSRIMLPQVDFYRYCKGSGTQSEA